MFPKEEFRKKKHLCWWTGVILFWAGLFLTFSDMFTNFPTPQHGFFGLRWLVFSAVGAVLWFKSKKLPLEETLGIVEELGYKVTPAMLAKELGVSIPIAEKTLSALEKQGYAVSIIDMENASMIYSFHSLKRQISAVAPPQKRARQNPERNDSGEESEEDSGQYDSREKDPS